MRKQDQDRKPKPSRFKKRRPRPCMFCIEKRDLNYKDVGLVRRFVTDRGKIAPRRISGCCASHQRMVARIIKKTRQMGLTPYVME